MGYSDDLNGSDFTIVTDVLQYSVFAREGDDLGNLRFYFYT